MTIEQLTDCDQPRARWRRHPGSNTPGADPRLQRRALGVPATMLPLEITGGVESGTLYAAPQIAGIAALLLQHAIKLAVRGSGCLHDGFDPSVLRTAGEV